MCAQMSFKSSKPWSLVLKKDNVDVTEKHRQSVWQHPEVPSRIHPLNLQLNGGLGVINESVKASLYQRGIQSRILRPLLVYEDPNSTTEALESYLGVWAASHSLGT